MRSKQMSPRTAKSKYRQYSQEDLKNAYIAVKNKSMTVRGASLHFKVPRQTLRDRLSGRIDIDTSQTNPPPVFTEEEELDLVNHMTSVAKSGYCYSKQEIINMAAEYASNLEKVTDDKTFTLKWYRSFMKRCPEVKKLVSAFKPVKTNLADIIECTIKTLDEPVPEVSESIEPTNNSAEDTEATPVSTVSNYFLDLREILHRYNLLNKPHCIFNVQEKEMSRNIFDKSFHPQTSRQSDHPYTSSSHWMTILGAGNAAGMAIPPYLVFPGKRKHPYMMKGATPGAACTISQDGLSNTTVLKDYLEDHFLEYVPARKEQQILLILSGQMIDTSPYLLHWAKSHNIIMLIIPAHCSHFLQPLEVECYLPLWKRFESESHKMLRESPLAVIQETICQIACRSYNESMCPSNLHNGFSKTGIYPYNPAAIKSEFLLPTEVAILNQIALVPYSKSITSVTLDETEENLEEDEAEAEAEEKMEQECAEYSQENGVDENVEYSEETAVSQCVEESQEVRGQTRVCVDNIEYIVVERSDQLIL
ncbi:hypothetical protein ScPMuIL_006174 [Solemya velum]